MLLTLTWCCSTTAPGQFLGYVGLPLYLGLEVWGFCCPHLWQGSPVYFICLVWCLCIPQNLGLNHDLLLSLKQWDDQTVPLSSQICSMFLFSQFRLVSASSLSFIGIEDSSQGWHWPLCLQCCLWFYSHRSWRVLWESRVASLRLSSKIKQAVAVFTAPLPHHVPQSPPCQLPAALLSAKFVFVWKDVSIPSLAPMYRGPYLVLEQRDKFFCLQIGSRTEVVSVDHLKPVFSNEPVSPALPPACGRPTTWVWVPILRPPVVGSTFRPTSCASRT